MRIDLNSDIGESFGAWRMGADEDVLDHVTSANIACGFHAGDPATMRRTVELAHARGVAIGAHPSLPDLQGFGRREMRIDADEAHALVIYQVGALAAFARAAGSALTHVKPHGALYTMAARDRGLAEAIARAVHDVDARLVLVGLAASELTAAGARAGLRVAHEAFADRRYLADGRLVARSQADAVIEDVEAAVGQAVSIATRGVVGTIDGSTRAIQADTICVHGDRAAAGEFARRLRSALLDAGVALRPLLD